MNGLLGLEFGLLISKLRPHGLNYQNFHAYLQLWTWPVRLSSRAATGKDCCSNKGSASSLRAGVFKHTASEGLSVYAILADFVEKAVLPTGVEIPSCTSFLQLCLVLDLLVMVARGVVPPAILQLAIEKTLGGIQDGTWRGMDDPKTPHVVTSGTHAGLTRHIGKLSDP